MLKKINVCSALIFACFIFILQANTAFCADVIRADIAERENPRNPLISLKAQMAVTKEELSEGLMFRQSLPENEGMLFDLQKMMIPSMWMKNTLIPLDMLFIDDKGIIVYIKENTVPYSEELIVPTTPCRYVLEINAGLSEKYGIKIGQSLFIRPWRE